ncbi:MAG: hypothetical protein JWM16_6373 [Verrucomicrobiales bacterium]|nr:hypothetical protein [Verrucomicrobiales bacterium]
MTDFGFTGTSEGTTSAQRKAFRSFLPTSGMTKFRHGDCVHADCDAHVIVRQVLPAVPIHGHPPIKDAKRANCPFDTMSDPRPYLDRNRDIASECDELLAMPKGPETPRGGTWYTIRHARSLGKPVTIFWPDGKVERA